MLSQIFHTSNNVMTVMSHNWCPYVDLNSMIVLNNPIKSYAVMSDLTIYGDIGMDSSVVFMEEMSIGC